MKLPSGYGQIVKLSGKRRKPYAVRSPAQVVEVSRDKFVYKTKYLAYFEKRKDAVDYLAKYNAGIRLPEHKPIASMPTFAEVYDGFIAYRQNQRGGLSDALYTNYRAAFGRMTMLHGAKFANLRPDDLQAALNAQRNLSRTSVNFSLIVIRGMYKWAMRQEIIEKNYAELLTIDWTNKETAAHTPFTDEEILTLWDAEARIPLILIYTGLRGSEFLQMKTENIHLQARYMIGGMKTRAGKNRVVPIHRKIAGFIAELKGREELLFPKPSGFAYDFNGFFHKVWQPEMQRVGMNHKPHDARHTCASLLERADVPLLHRKLILGHTVKDITEGVYTHITPDVLVDDIDRIKV